MGLGHFVELVLVFLFRRVADFGSVRRSGLFRRRRLYTRFLGWLVLRSAVRIGN